MTLVLIVLAFVVAVVAANAWLRGVRVDLTENNLYTVEAFKDYVTHLTPDGVLTMTRWLLDPPQQELRLISVTRAMWSSFRWSISCADCSPRASRTA